jgi:hypothetical protein
VLPEAIIQESGLVMIPALRTDRASCIRVYIYSRQPQSALNQAAEGFTFLDARIRDGGNGLGRSL